MLTSRFPLYTETQKRITTGDCVGGGWSIVLAYRAIITREAGLLKSIDQNEVWLPGGQNHRDQKKKKSVRMTLGVNDMQLCLGRSFRSRKENA